MRANKVIGLLLSSLLCVFVGPAFYLNAQNSPSLSPVRTILDANPGEKKQTTINIKNSAPTTEQYIAVFNNFTAADGESGEPKISSDISLPYGIKTWLSGETRPFAVAGNGSFDYVLSVAVPKDAKPGTYYGLVLFSNTNDGGVSAAVGSLVLVNVGAITRHIIVEEFNTEDVYVEDSGYAEGKFVVRLRNDGNGYTVPKIKIDILNDQESVIEAIEGNESQGGILPGGIRKYTISFSKNLDPGQVYSARLTATSEDGETALNEKVLRGDPVTGLSKPAADRVESPPLKSNMLWLVGVGVIVALGVKALITYLAKKRKNTPSSMSSTFLQKPPSPSQDDPEDSTPRRN